MAINNVVGSRHEGREKAENGAFKVDFASVNIYNAIAEISILYFFLEYISFSCLKVDWF